MRPKIGVEMILDDDKIQEREIDFKQKRNLKKKEMQYRVEITSCYRLGFSYNEHFFQRILTLEVY